MSEEFQLEVDGLALACAGWNGGEPVLALHGWMDNAGSFAALAPLLDRWRVVAPDLPGHGRSDPMPDGSYYHYIDQLWFLHALLDRLQWKRCHLLGHSMGGTLVCLYAAVFPERVRSLVTIDALGPMFDRPDQLVHRLREGIEARAAAIPEARRFTERSDAVAARHAGDRLSPEAAEALAERGLEHDPGGWYWSADRRHRLPSLYRLTEEQIQALLAAVKAPTLAIAARDCHYEGLLTLIRRRAAVMTGVELIELPGRHHLHLDDPRPVADTISEFLLRHPLEAD